MKKIVSTILIYFFVLSANAQTDPVLQYIESYKGLAMEEMKRSGVPASIKLAQGILESEVGASPLAQKSNNHFGIKCKSNWTGETTYHDDDARGECFRKYECAEQSYRDHSDFLKNSNRYSHLFSLDPADYRAWSYGLKKAGYATNPQYPQRLIRNIEKYDLQQYTLQVLEENGSLSKRVSSDEAENLPTDNETFAEATENRLASLPEWGKKTEHNGLKAVYAVRGTSLLALASTFKLSLSRLLEYNDLGNDGILSADQWIYLEKKWKEGKTEYYIAGEGESLYSVSQSAGVQLAQLRHFNRHLQINELPAGTRVILKSGVYAKENAEADGKILIHEVKPKEGLYSISRKYNVSVEEIKLRNNLSDESLRIGQQLIISN